MDYSGSIYITLDMDWVPDEILLFCYDLIVLNDIKATLLATNASASLALMRQHPDIELGWHPTFNNTAIEPLAENILPIIQQMQELAPNSTCYRSHCLTQNSRLQAYLAQYLTYDLNCFIPLHAGIKLQPWRHYSGMISVPFFFADDLWSSSPHKEQAEDFLNTTGIKVFAFHPVHLFLNTCSQSHYMEAKLYYQEMDQLGRYINSNAYGVRNFFYDLIRLAKIKGLQFKLISQIAL